MAFYSSRNSIPSPLGRRYAAGAVLLASAVLLLPACRLDGAFGDRPEDGRAHEVVFRVAEGHAVAPEAPDVPRLFFEMWTKEAFGCSGYTIRHTVERDGRRVVVRALGIETIDQCVASVGPARARFELPLAPGTYGLVLVNGGMRDGYTLVVSEDRVEVAAGRASWTEPAATLHWRYPRDSFAYSCGTTPDAGALCADFEGRLQELPLSRLALPEEGVWPYLPGPSGYAVDAPARFYRYPADATWQEVKRRLEAFTREHLRGREGVGLRVENWLSDGVMSWTVHPGRAPLQPLAR